MVETRVLPLDGVYNFRDYGGYAVAGGGRVKRGVLWRSGEHGGASDADLGAIGALGLTTVFDLRGNSERAANPCKRPEGFAATVHLTDGETAGLGLHVEAAGGAFDPESARTAMLGLYKHLPYRANLLPIVRTYLHELARSGGASLVHCVAGKDRTGFAVAVVHLLLGVHPDDAMADYLLTNSSSQLDERIAAGAFAALPRYAGRDDATIRALWGVAPEYLATSLAAIAERYPTIEAYADGVLGFGPDEVQSLRASLLVT